MKVRELLALLRPLDGELEVFVGDMDGDELEPLGQVENVSVEEHEGDDVCALTLSSDEEDDGG